MAENKYNRVNVVCKSGQVIDRCNAVYSCEPDSNGVITMPTGEMYKRDKTGALRRVYEGQSL